MKPHMGITPGMLWYSHTNKSLHNIGLHQFLLLFERALHIIHTPMHTMIAICLHLILFLHTDLEYFCTFCKSIS